jgi:hypothetical protein
MMNASRFPHTGCSLFILACLLVARTSCAQALPNSQPTESRPTEEDEPAPPTLAEILLGDIDRGLLMSEAMPSADAYPAPVIDESRLKRLGLRKLTGRYIRIWTDLESSPEVDGMATLFDEAVEAWNRYFVLEEESLVKLQLTGYVMKDERRFQKAGLIPRDLPPFLHGYQRGYELWVRDQPSDYYRRHLLLHEGVHGFMNILLGATGPPWYREGMAEHLATHRRENGRLQVGVMPRSRDEVPYWGRIKIMQDQYEAGTAKMLGEIMQLGNDDFLQTDGYAWAWAAVAYLDGHPSYRHLFRQLRHHVSDHPVRFSRRLLDPMTTRLRPFDEQWQLFIINVDYGYDFVAENVRYRLGVPFVTGAPREVKVAVDRGWQSTGIRLSVGKLYRVVASGQFQLRQTPEVWWSEPGGVTLTYRRGLPLGMLLGVVRPDEPPSDLIRLGNPMAIGRQRLIRPIESGTLYLRINDFPGEVRENVGEISVVVMEIEPSEQKKRGETNSSVSAAGKESPATDRQERMATDRLKR